MTRSDTGSTCARFKTSFEVISAGPASPPAVNETITSDLRQKLSDITVYWGIMAKNSPVKLSISIDNIRYNGIS